MYYRVVRAILLVAISLVSAAFVIGNSPLTSILPKANAAVPGSNALLGLFHGGFFHEPTTGSAIVNSTYGTSTFVKFDVNVTGAGAIKGFIVNITWTSTALTVTNSSFGNYINGGFHGHSNPWCPASQGCIFDGLGSGALELANSTTAIGGGLTSYYLAVTDQCTTSCSPTVPGTGILFRIGFKPLGTSVNTVIHFQTATTTIENPGAVPYKNIDGYFDNHATPTFNYAMSSTPSTIVVTRPVTGTVTSGGVSITLGAFTGAGAVSFSALGLPKNTPLLFSPNTACSAACTTTLTLTVNGGQAGASGTTPSGTYAVAIVSNATSLVPGMIKETWFSLVINPPAAPSYTFSTSTTKFKQEEGTFNLFSLTATLTGGANDSLTESVSTCGFVQVTCTVTPSAGQFGPTTFSSSLNASTTLGTPTGVYVFNVTATTQGTYSEVTVTRTITFTITIVKTHDLGASSETMPKLFSYEGVSLVRPSGHPINMTATFVNEGRSTESFNANATARTTLSSESPNNITFVDTAVAGFWKPGDAVIYDVHGTRSFTSDDIVMAGSAPIVGTSLITDTHLRFVDNNFNGRWNCFTKVGNVCTSGKTVIYDSNANGVYDKGDIVISGAPPSLGVLVGTGCVGTGCLTSPNPLLPADPVVSGSVANNTSLATDSKIKFWDLNGTGVFGGGQESVVYDSNGNGAYDAYDPHIKFYDSNFTGTWGCSAHTGSTCTAGKPIFYDANNNGRYDTGETIIFGTCTSPCGVGVSLKTDLNIRYVDSNSNNVWNSGEPVVYDSDNNGIYDAADLVISGTPTLGAFLKGEPVMSGLAPPSGTTLASDTKLKFADANHDGVWDNSEAVVYDFNSLGVFFNGARSIIINVDPENAPHGLYTIFSYVIPVPGEVNIANNGLGIIGFTQKLRGDINGDCKVNIVDLTLVAGIFGSATTPSTIASDLNNDGIINIFDLSLVGSAFGATC